MKVSNWKNIDKGTLKGSFDMTLILDQGKFEITIHECTLFEKDGRQWVSFPSRKYEKDGEARYIPYVSLPKDLKAKVEAECLKQLPEIMDPIPLPDVAETADMPF